MLDSRETDLAWAAGFYDGEGCTTGSSSTDGYFRPSVKIAQARSPEVLYRFRSIVERGSVYGPRHRNGQQPYWEYSVNGDDNVKYVIGIMWEYLSTQKREQALAIFARIDADDSKPRRHKGPIKRATCGRGHADWWITPNGKSRQCRVCHAARQRKNNKKP